MINKSGPKIDPCETPQDTILASEIVVSTAQPIDFYRLDKI